MPNHRPPLTAPGRRPTIRSIMRHLPVARSERFAGLKGQMSVTLASGGYPS